MVYHPIPEYLPQDVAAELRQHGVDKKVLLFQGFSERAAQIEIAFFRPRILRKTGNDFQRNHDLKQPIFRLFELFRYFQQLAYALLLFECRGERIRTFDPLLPKQVR